MSKVLASHKAAEVDPKHSTFLKSFGEFQVPKLDQVPVSADRAIIEMLNEMRSDMARLTARLQPNRMPWFTQQNRDTMGLSLLLDAITDYLSKHPGTSPDALLTDAKAQNDIIEASEAVKYFSNSPAFKAALETAVDLHKGLYRGSSAINLGSQRSHT